MTTAKRTTTKRTPAKRTTAAKRTTTKIEPNGRGEIIQQKQEIDQKHIEEGNTKYDRKVVGKYDTGTATVDVYRVLDAFEVTNPQLSHLIKKALCAGLRGHKDTEQDLVDIVHSAQSALDMFRDKNK